MRIAVYHNLPSGGAKRSLGESVRRLAECHTIDVYTLSSAEHDFADLRPHVRQYRVYDFAPLPLLRSPFGRANPVTRTLDLRRVRAVEKQIAHDISSEGYDVAFVQPCIFEKAPAILSYLAPLPTAYYCHEPPRQLHEKMPDRPYEAHRAHRVALDRVDPMPRLYRSELGRADRAHTRDASRVLVNSRYMQSVINGIYGIESHVSAHGVDSEWLRPDDRGRERFVLSVGSLTPLKGFDFLIRALATLAPKFRPPLVIASNFQNPPERAYLESLAAELDVNLKLSGSVSDAELAELYRRAWVVAYAPVREPFGLVALEAMASATPVVAVAEGGVVESVVHEETGLLTGRAPAAFAQALLRVLDDEHLASQLGRNGRDRVLRFWTWDQAIKTLEAHFRDVVAQRGQASAAETHHSPEKMQGERA